MDGRNVFRKRGTHCSHFLCPSPSRHSIPPYFRTLACWDFTVPSKYHVVHGCKSWFLLFSCRPAVTALAYGKSAVQGTWSIHSVRIEAGNLMDIKGIYLQGLENENTIWTMHTWRFVNLLCFLLKDDRNFSYKYRGCQKIYTHFKDVLCIMCKIFGTPCIFSNTLVIFLPSSTQPLPPYSCLEHYN